MLQGGLVSELQEKPHRLGGSPITPLSHFSGLPGSTGHWTPRAHKSRQALEALSSFSGTPGGSAPKDGRAHIKTVPSPRNSYTTQAKSIGPGVTQTRVSVPAHMSYCATLSPVLSPIKWENNLSRLLGKLNARLHVKSPSHMALL